MHLESYKQTLSSSVIFSGFDFDKLDLFLDSIQAYTLRLEDGEYFKHTGDYMAYYPFILSGSIKAYMTRGPQNNLVAQFFAGDSFGEAIPTSLIVSPVEMIAFGDTRLLILPAEKLHASNNEYAHLILNRLKAEQAKKIAKLVETLGILSETRLEDKIMSYLKGLEAQDDGYIYVPLSRAEWAGYLRVADKSLSRELKCMENKGLIKVRGRYIHICTKYEK